jgi:hypothetical protein
LLGIEIVLVSDAANRDETTEMVRWQRQVQEQRRNAGVLHCVQDDGVKRATAKAKATATTTTTTTTTAKATATATANTEILSFAQNDGVF